MTVAARIDALVTPRRLLIYPALFIVVGLLLELVPAFTPPIGKSLGATDFMAHWLAGNWLVSGHTWPLFDVATQRAITQQMFGPDHWHLFDSPPFDAVLYAPLGLLPAIPADGLWTVFSLILLGLAAWLLRPLLPGFSPARWRIALVVCAASYPLLSLIWTGQDSAVSLLLWIAGIRLALARRDGWAGAVFALGLFKPQLFWLPPLVFLAQRRYRACVAWLVVSAAIAGGWAAAFGADSYVQWFRLLTSPITLSSAQTGMAWDMQSLPAFLQTLGPSQFAEPLELAGLLLALAVLAALFVTHQRQRQPDGLSLWCSALLLTLLVSPHLLVYDLMLALPVALILLDRCNSRQLRLTLLSFFFLTWSLPLRHVLVSHATWPLTVLGDSWGAVPLLLLFWLNSNYGIARRGVRRTSAVAQPIPLVAAGTNPT